MDSPVRRRSLLAGFGAGLCAGCLGKRAETGVPAGTGSDTTSTPTESGEESVTLDATVIDSFTESHPGRLRLTLTNRTDDLLLSLGVRRGIDGPFTAIRGSRRDDERELLLFYQGRDLDSYVLCAESSETPIPETRVDGCWQPQCATGLEVISTHGSVVLDPGETLRGEYTVLDGFDDGCLASGTYAFSDDASELGSGEKTDHGVEFASDPTRVVRYLDITLDESGTVSASADAIVQTDDTADTPTTPADTPGSTPQRSTSENLNRE